jgi:ribosomal protein S18 acetylase RimI-like enzyme
MKSGGKATIRAFDGSPADAERLLAVERATFDESPYTADQVRSMLTNGSQRAWLADVEGEVAGFVIAFPSWGLRGPCWEIDLLAVLPAWRGYGLATRLIRAACAGGAGIACRARGVVAAHNSASARAFWQAGFRQQTGSCQLLIYRTEALSAPARLEQRVPIQEITELDLAADWLPAAQTKGDHPGLILLLAGEAGRPAGYAELIEVQTLLYKGIWIESLVTATRTVRDALVHRAVHRAIAMELDEIGAMVPGSDGALQQSLLSRGFRTLGEFRWLTARLPLAGHLSTAEEPSLSPITNEAR